MKHKMWCGAISNEVDALELKKTWDVENLRPGKFAMGSKWVFKLKFNVDGTIERHKARLVALENRQVKGEDFDETFAPVIKMSTVRVLLRTAAAKN